MNADVDWRSKMLAMKLMFAVVVAALITIGVAVPAHAIAVKVFNSSGVQCGTTDTDGTFSVTCDDVAVSGTVTAETNGTTRQFKVSNFVADSVSTVTVTKTIRVNATHTFSGSVGTAGIGWTGDFYRSTSTSTVAKSSSTSFTGSVTCLPSNSVTTLTSASYTVPSTATTALANHFAKGTTKTPVPTNCTSQTLTGNINVTLQGSSTFNDKLVAHSSANLYLGEQVDVKLAVVADFVSALALPTNDVKPDIPGKVQVVLLCKKDFDDNADPEQAKWSLPNPFGTIVVNQTTFGTAHVENNKVGKADVDGNGCVDARMQFQVLDTSIQCGDTSAPFHTFVELCIEEIVTTGPPGNPNTRSETRCELTEVLVDVQIDTTQACGF